MPYQSHEQLINRYLVYCMYSIYCILTRKLEKIFLNHKEKIHLQYKWTYAVQAHAVQGSTVLPLKQFHYSLNYHGVNTFPVKNHWKDIPLRENSVLLCPFSSGSFI